MGKFIQKISCPKCLSRDNVGVYKDGEILNGTCFGCGENYHDIDPTDPQFDYRTFNGQTPQEASQQPLSQNAGTYSTQLTKEQEMALIAEYPILPIHERWDLEEAKAFQVKAAIGPDGKPSHIYYPHFNIDGAVRYYKERNLATKDFRIIGSVSHALPFGFVGIPEGVPCLVLTEGEDDAGAAKKMFRLYGKNYPCVSIPTGATLKEDTGEGVIDTSLQKHLPRIASARVVYLCLDQDQAGVALTRVLAEELAVHTEVRIMKLPEKDAREMMKNGRQQEFWDAFLTATQYVPEALVWAGDVEIEELTRPLLEGLPLPLPELQAKMHGLRYGPNAGELTILTGGSGVGKSTLLRFIQNHALKSVSSLKVGTIFLEEQFIKTLQGMVAMYWGVKLAELRVNPQMLTNEQWKEARDFFGYRQMFLKHFGSVASKRLTNKLYHMHRQGIELIGLDHISMVVAGQKSGSGGERKDIDMLMEALANFCVVTGCHVVAIVHLKRGDRKVVRNSEGQVNLEIAPYDRGGEITKTDLRGSGGIEQMSDNIISVEGDLFGTTGLFAPNDRWVRVLKNREWNELGLAGMYEVDSRTGLMIPKHCTR